SSWGRFSFSIVHAFLGDDQLAETGTTEKEPRITDDA
uniref:Uncharacterized protein n=1 Tax=Aegilops tauschii subsp. strangulata TaxID=200361 RepID=A0A453HHD4_AEGTS